MRSIRLLFSLLASALSLTPLALAQVPDPAAANAAPIPGAGHHYIGVGTETVNPADGLLSFELPIQTPAGRQLIIPFGFRYSSGEQFYLTNNGVGTSLHYVPRQSTGWELNGWSYDLPTLAASSRIYEHWTTYTGQPPQGQVDHQCDASQNYVFRGFGGAQYTLNLGTQWVDPNYATGTTCNGGNFNSASSSRHGVFANMLTSDPLPPISVTDQSGTVYQFAGSTNLYVGLGADGPTWASLASTITDRNGNQISASTNGYNDTLGRTAVSWTGFGNNGDQVAVAGLSTNITLNWANVPVTFPEASHNVAGNGNCSAGNTPSTTINVVSEIDLPNGQKYTFAYDATYGLVSKITFPGGGYVRYLWGLNTSSAAAYFAAQIPVQGGTVSVWCDAVYDNPAVTDRYVSYDGTTEVLHQHFAYSTQWNSTTPYVWNTKSTTVTSTDLVTGQITSINYAYADGGADTGGPYDYNVANNVPRQGPVEQSVVYQDGSGHTLKTVDKTWLNPFAMAGEQTVLDNGQGITSLRCYDANEQVTNLYEYGFQSEGSKPADPSCASSSGLTVSAIGPLKRRSATAYHNFIGATPSTHIVSEPDSVTVYDGSGNQIQQASFAYDANSVVASGTATGLAGPPGVRGNISTVTHWLNTGGSSPATSYTYFDTGQIATKTDACGNAACSDMTGSNHTTTYSYADNFDSPPSGSTNAYLTQITDSLGHVSKFKYAYSDGQLIQSQDQNDINAQRTGTTYVYNDSLRRPTETDYADGGKTTSSYSDAAPSPSITTTHLITASPSLSLSNTSIMDGLGHVVQTQLTSDPDGTTYGVTTYDGLGRPYQIYNPTRCNQPTTNCGESTWGITTTLYDALGRTCLVVPPDGTLPTSNACPTSQPLNTVFTTYSGNCTTVTDQAGKARKSCWDALGPLIQVFEDPSGFNYETDYSYNALNNLLSVNQKGGSSDSSQWRPRRFVYDSLSHLTSATNPESGTITYSYDANGNLASKTSPAPNQTGSATVTLSYCYDALNRLASKAYTAQSCPMSSPIASYFYDQSSYNGLTITNAIGRRTGMADQAGSEAWSYDSMGRPLTENRATNAITRTTGYTYNLDGSLSNLTYPGSTGATVSYVQGGAGRPLSAYDGFGLAYSAQYAPNGSLCSVSSAWGQAFEHNYTFNNRFQIIDIQDWDQTWYASDHGSSPPPCTAIADGPEEELHLTYSYTDAGGHNNGNVQQMNNNLNMEITQLYTYDSFNRLATAETLHQNQPWWSGDSPTGACWSEQYTYDAWGNMSAIAPVSSAYTGCTQESLSMTPTIKNQLQDTNNDFVYDAAGNLIQPGPTGGPYVFDAENHLISAGGMAYLYDGDGKRVGKAPASTPTQPNYLYWYGDGSQILQETDGAGNFLYNDLYFNGMRFDRQESDNWADHFFADALGNTRCVYGDNDPDGGCSDYYPFGGERPISNGGVNVPFKFTGKERDAESGLDNFGARYNSSSMGRFMSPDPVAGHTEDPQTLNRYAYVANNPLNRTDPSGLDWYLGCATSDHSGCKQVQIDPNNKKSLTWVQTGKDGNATIITSDSIRAGQNTATVSENGVQINGKNQGVYFENPANDASHWADGKDHNQIDLAGSGALKAFNFHIDGNCSGTCRSSGEWTLNANSYGTIGDLLTQRGAFTNSGEDAVAFFGYGAHPYSTQYRFGGPLNSPHLSVPYDRPGTVPSDPTLNVPRSGGFHVDSHSDWRHAIDVAQGKPE